MRTWQIAWYFMCWIGEKFLEIPSVLEKACNWLHQNWKTFLTLLAGFWLITPWMSFVTTEYLLLLLTATDTYFLMLLVTVTDERF